MKKNLQGVIIGVIIGTLLTSGIVFGEQISKTAELFYQNIKIYIDGAEIVPKDATGNIVEPFIYNGTTYLPVRAISNTFGKDVEWDGSTQSVYIGKKDQTKPDNYLTNIQYNDYQKTFRNNDFVVINGSITDYNQNVYKNGLIFDIVHSSYDDIENDEDDADVIISYPLNSQYSNLKGIIVLPKACNLTTWGEDDNLATSPTDIWFYGDGKLLYKATHITSSMPFDFDINTSGVNQLAVKIKTKSGNSSYVALTDLALYK